jgi:GxxExxY protein
MNHRVTEPQRETIPQYMNHISGLVVQAAFAVHSQLGPGLLESVYEKCMAHAIQQRGLSVQRQIVLPVIFEGLKIDTGLRLDMLVDKCVVVEVKAVETVLPVHKAQLLTYLRLSGQRLGLLVNFNVRMIKNGITRMVN